MPERPRRCARADPWARAPTHTEGRVVTVSDISEVWTPMSAILAIVAGVGYGLLVGWIATDPTYSAGTASAARLAVIAIVFAASAGLIFFALQTLGTYLSGD